MNTPRRGVIAVISVTPPYILCYSSIVCIGEMPKCNVIFNHLVYYEFQVNSRS